MVLGGEDSCSSRWFPGIDDVVGALAQLGQCIRANKPFDGEYTIAAKSGDLGIIEKVSHVGSVSDRLRGLPRSERPCGDG